MGFWQLPARFVAKNEDQLKFLHVRSNDSLEQIDGDFLLQTSFMAASFKRSSM